jgi:hypothetical protein
MTREHYRQDLIKAGASKAFAKVYLTSHDGRHSIVSEVDSGPFTLDQLADGPGIGGHFFHALWNGDTEEAWNRADMNNRRIMEKAGIAPNSENTRMV